MVVEIALKFVLGGAIVSLFAVIGDMLRPKSFSGIFGAAPTVALATLGMAFMKHGGSYAAIEGRSMLAGAFAMLCYTGLVTRLLMRQNPRPWLAAGASWTLWLAVSLCVWAAVLR